MEKHTRTTISLAFLASIFNFGCGEDGNYESGQDSDCKTPGFVKCNGVCIDPNTSSSYCGANTYCEGYKICSPDQTCQNGNCITGCTENSTQCSPTGIPQICLSGTWHDKTPCDKGMTCQNGLCIDESESPQFCNTQGYVKCNGTCIDPMNSDKYCGADANCKGYDVCANNESCQSGKCIPTTCPKDQHVYKGNCEPDSVMHCGEHDFHCANKIDGWSNGECSGGKCSATECAGSFHLYNHTCEKDTKDNCGEHNLNCRISMPGFLDGQCINHSCKASLCTKGYHLYMNTCEPDDEAHCGKHTTNCSNIQGYATGECVEGECRIHTCTAGYHLDSANNRCIADTNDCCGSSCSNCTTPNVCSNGVCAAQCQSPLSKCNNECHNYANDINHCGGCNKPCTTASVSDSTNVTCNNSTCKATSCRSGYHVYDGKCEKDTVENCGSHGSQCNTANAINTICSDGICQVTACKTNYHIYNNECEADSNSNCGTHGKICSIDNGTMACESGECVFKQCDNNYHYDNNACVDETPCCGNSCDINLMNDSANCGKCDNKCNVGEICISGICTTTENCKNLYCYTTGSGDSYCNGKAVNLFTDSANCGQCGRECGSKRICVSGNCRVGLGEAYCDGKYVYTPTDSENCGKCGKKCASTEGCLGGECKTGYGKPTDCNGKYIYTVHDSANCGQCGNKCGVGQICNNGKCEYSFGKTYCDGKYVNTKLDSANCGQCGKKCTNGTICYEGKCSMVNNFFVSCADDTINCKTYCDGIPIYFKDYANMDQCGQIRSFISDANVICDGIPVHTKSDPENCGRCYHICPSGLGCRDGVCLTKCGNIVTSLVDDSANCGECGNICDYGYTCSSKTNNNGNNGGICRSGLGPTYCNNIKTNTSNDVNNCGQCGKSCPTLTTCKEGICTANYTEGATLYFGFYKNKPIEWRILSVDTSAHKLLLISEYILDTQPYNLSALKVNWGESTIRSWLNGYDSTKNVLGVDYTTSNFISSAFSSEERAKILNTSVKYMSDCKISFDDVSVSYKTSSDWIFFLSEEEFRDFKVSFNQSADWWLRTPGCNATAYDLKMCRTANTGCHTSPSVASHIGVRPVLWVSY